MAISIEELSEENFRRWVCTKCELSFENSTDLANHLAEDHSDVKKLGTFFDTDYRYNLNGYNVRSYDYASELIRDYPSCKELKKVRCPSCGNWGAYEKGRLKCAHCGEKFERKETAFMDGVYLNEWGIQDRYEKYIREGTKKLDMDLDSVVDRATEMVEQLPSSIKGGRSPRTISAGATYLSIILEGERRTQDDVADAFNVSPMAVRERYKDIRQKFGGWESIAEEFGG